MIYFRNIVAKVLNYEEVTKRMYRNPIEVSNTKMLMWQFSTTNKMLCTEFNWLLFRPE